MEFKEIYKMQLSLDEKIHTTHNVTFEDTIDKKILALMVEIGEFANEIKPFKYWKKDKSINRDNVLEEFVDGIHFFVSLANYFNLETNIEALIVDDDSTVQLINIYAAVAALKDNLNKENLTHAFKLYMGIAKLSKLTDDEIKNYYISKNKVNYERIANNY